MPAFEAPSVELGSAPEPTSVVVSPSPSEISSASSPEPQNVRATPLFRALAMPPPEPEQPPGQDELERRLPGYRRIIIPRELTLIELLKQCSGVTTDEEVLRIREAKLRVVAERVGLRRLHVLSPRLRTLILDGSALGSLRDLGIGLVHLKILSVNKCGLNSLDGVWGLGALREFFAAGNRIQDLQPLAALQKLHTLNLADNPISDTDRLWTLAVCGSLRRLTLSGTRAADTLDYRTRVAAALPMLVYLDDCPMHNHIDYDIDGLVEPLSSSDSESDREIEKLQPRAAEEIPPAEPEPGPSSSSHENLQTRQPTELGPEDNMESYEATAPLGPVRRWRRPATTEGAGVRPSRPNMPPRPKTTLGRPNVDAPTRLQILNTLMDEEWRCSGSKLTSGGAVCGNLARALRRPNTAYHRRCLDAEKELVEQTMEDATRTLAAEIPRAPCLEDWVKFKLETGIDIDIDFTSRPEEGDSSAAIDRLEQIERETFERFKNADDDPGRADRNDSVLATASTFSYSMDIRNDFELWKLDLTPTEPIYDVDALFNGITGVSPNRRSPELHDYNEPAQ